MIRQVVYCNYTCAFQVVSLLLPRFSLCTGLLSFTRYYATRDWLIILCNFDTAPFFPLVRRKKMFQKPPLFKLSIGPSAQTPFTWAGFCRTRWRNVTDHSELWPENNPIAVKLPQHLRAPRFHLHRWPAWLELGNREHNRCSSLLPNRWEMLRFWLPTLQERCCVLSSFWFRTTWRTSKSALTYAWRNTAPNSLAMSTDAEK